MNTEKYILDFLEGNSQINYNWVIYFLGIVLVLLWVFYIFWVWSDSSQRSSNIFFRLGSLLLVALFNFIGLAVYLVIRPRYTIEQIYWMDLERRYLIFETAELRDCNNCGFQLRPDFNVCPQCGHDIKVECESCKEMINKNWKFCPYCSTQARDRRAAVEVLSEEVMEKSVEESVQEAVQHVEQKKNRYARQTSIVASIGHWVIEKTMMIGKAVDTAIKKIFSPRKRVEVRTQTELNGKVVIDTGFTKKKKKKKKKRSRRR